MRSHFLLMVIALTGICRLQAVETNAMVDQPEVPVHAHQDVAALTVGVVDYQVEKDNRAQTLVVGLGKLEICQAPYFLFCEARFDGQP